MLYTNACFVLFLTSTLLCCGYTVTNIISDFHLSLPNYHGPLDIPMPLIDAL